MEHQSSLRAYAGEEAIQIRAIKPAPLGDFLETFFFFFFVRRTHAPPRIPGRRLSEWPESRCARALMLGSSDGCSRTLEAQVEQRWLSAYVRGDSPNSLLGLLVTPWPWLDMRAGEMVMQHRMPDACAQLSSSERARCILCIPVQVCDMSEQRRDLVRIPDRESTGEPFQINWLWGEGVASGVM